MILILSLLSGALSGFSFLLLMLRFFTIKSYLNDVIIFAALVTGVISGALLSPLAFWCLKDKNLWVIVPILNISLFLLIMLLRPIASCIGGLEAFHAFYVIFILWVLALILSKFIAPTL
jgi:hypothetical protein